MRDAEQNLDTLLDYLDQFVVYSCNANRSDRSELESQLEYEEESMCYDEMHEKYEVMTHEELMKKHIEISWIADAAKFFSQLIEWYYIKGLVVDLKNYFRDAQNLKDLIEKYKKPEPETLEMIKPRSKKIGRKSRSDWEAERKAQEAKREEERKFSKNLVKKMNFRCRNMSSYSERYRGPVPVILLSKSPHGKCNSFALS